MLMLPTVPTQTRKDFASDQEVRWCPGCGDYSILAQMQKTLPELGIARENMVFISGIGCSSRFPYYMDTYGIHSIHGRAPTLATGLKIARPDLHVFVITGDGDSLSIGGNHLLHVLRRNVNLTIVLFNNRIYGLTKGQYSPTSLPGAKTKSSPMGTVETPLNPLSVALAAEATFVARSIDTEIKHLGDILKQAAEHKGASFVEVFQNCNIFNDGAWDHVKEKATQKDRVLWLEHGKPMTFGAAGDKGLRFNTDTLQPEIAGEGFMTHDVTRDSTAMAYLLSRLTFPEYPVPVGVFRKVERPTYEQGVMDQVARARQIKGTGDLRALYCSSDLWSVGNDGRENHTLSSSSPELLGEMLEGWAKGYSEVQGRGTRTLLSSLTLEPVQALPLTASLRQLLLAGGAGVALTDANGCYAATVTDADLVRVASLVSDLDGVTAEQVASCRVGSIPVGANLSQAAQQMSHLALAALTVVDGECKPVGRIPVKAVQAALA